MDNQNEMTLNFMKESTTLIKDKMSEIIKSNLSGKKIIDNNLDKLYNSIYELNEVINGLIYIIEYKFKNGKEQL